MTTTERQPRSAVTVGLLGLLALLTLGIGVMLAAVVFDPATAAVPRGVGLAGLVAVGLLSTFAARLVRRASEGDRAHAALLLGTASTLGVFALVPALLTAAI